jgi:hypothetical protein
MIDTLTSADIGVCVSVLARTVNRTEELLISKGYSLRVKTHIQRRGAGRRGAGRRGAGRRGAASSL